MRRGSLFFSPFLRRIFFMPASNLQLVGKLFATPPDEQIFSLPPLRGGSYYGHYLKSRHRQLGGGSGTAFSQGFSQGFVPGPLPLSICLKLSKKSDAIS